METGHTVEVEWQFGAPEPDAVERWLSMPHDESGLSLRDLGTHEQRDTYFDTAGWHVYFAGYALRLRERDGRVETALKSLVPSPDGPTHRHEITEVGDLTSVNHPGTGPVGRRLRLILRGHAPGPIAEVSTHRRTWRVLSDIELAEIALDRARVGRPGATGTSLAHVEIEEIAPGGLEAANALIEELREGCNLSVARSSKFEAALEAAGSQPGPPDLGPTSVAAGDRAVERAYAVLRRRFRDFLVHESGTALGEDPEALHEIRVATRRLRAALTVFEPVLPRDVTAADQSLRWFGRAVGRARDLDVQLEYLARVRSTGAAGPPEPLDALLTHFDGRRVEAREDLLAALADDRYHAFVAAFGGQLRAGVAAQAPTTPSRELASRAIRREFRRFRRRARRITRGSPPQAYHQLRIRGKRLRYSLELFRDLQPEVVKPALRSLRQLQDLLGELQDLSTLGGDLVTAADDEAAGLPAQTLVAVGRLLEQHHARRAAIITSAPRAIERVLTHYQPVRAATKAAAVDMDTPGRARRSSPRE